MSIVETSDFVLYGVGNVNFNVIGLRSGKCIDQSNLYIRLNLGLSFLLHS